MPKSRASAMSLAVRTAVPEGLSFLPSWWNSMTSASGKYLAACWAKSIISTAPVVKLGAQKSAAPPAADSS